MIHYFVPTSDYKDLGEAYNYYSDLVPHEEDWIVIKDRDVLFLQEQYHDIIKDAIRNYPNTGLFTCLTNRVGEKRQCYLNRISEDSDIRNHKMIANQLKGNKTCTIIEPPISGMVMIFKKRTWIKTGGFKNGLLGVDNDFSYRVKKAGLDTKIINGLYVFHYYRLCQGIGYKQHLK